MIRIALSSDAKGFAPVATLLASILRRTNHPVHVRCWCRDFLPGSFQQRHLTVEFLPAEEEVTGKFPGYVGPAVFDRLRVIRDCPDWDRCLVMDYDQLALCDLAPLFELDLGTNLLAARMQGPGVDMAYAMQHWVKKPLPPGWEHVADFPYFSMGPLMNLAAMREAGTWETFAAAHLAFGVDEQLSLTAATEGRTIGFDRKWNLFPKRDIRGDEVPEGVIHWTGWPKPWHPKAKVWRPDIWEAERVTWEHLRMGIWEKPVMVEVEADDDRAAEALVKRGWKVWSLGTAAGIPGGAAVPDWRRMAASREAFREVIGEEAPRLDAVRIGQWVDAAEWLGSLPRLPLHVVLRGARRADEISRVVALGYGRQHLLKPAEWPAGGPLPRVLAYEPVATAEPLTADEAIFLEWTGMTDGVTPAKPAAPAIRPEPRRIGLIVAATGDRARHLPALVRSVRRNFLCGHEVTIFAFSDSPDLSPAGIEVIAVEATAESPPGPFSLIRDHSGRFAEIDYLYHLDADRLVVAPVGDEILGECVAALHPGYHDKPRQVFPYESKPGSRAKVAPHEGTRYYSGAFWGGRAEFILQAANRLASAMDDDAAQGLTATWRDESHWNRLLIDEPPTLELSPGHAAWPDWKSREFPVKVCAVARTEEVVMAARP